jgi:hypothetical protein
LAECRHGANGDAAGRSIIGARIRGSGIAPATDAGCSSFNRKPNGFLSAATVSPAAVKPSAERLDAFSRRALSPHANRDTANARNATTVAASASAA